MYRSENIKIDLREILIFLFCLYAFSLPFELVLEILYGIDTIFKPFRVMSLLIAGVFGIQVLKRGVTLSADIRADIFLYLIFVYGIIVSSIQIIGSVFNMNLFYSDLLLVGLHVVTFFIFKATPMSRVERHRIFRFFIWGVFVNSAYTLYNLFVLSGWGRQSGFMDNPNYTALSLMALIAYFILRLNYVRGFWKHLLFGSSILLLIYIFVITGSRTGLVMFIVVSLLVFLFSTFRKKLFIVSLIGLIVLLLLPQKLEESSLGGPLVLVRRVSKKLDSDQEDVRFAIWRGLFRMLEDKGYAGLGIGQYKANFPRYYGEESNKLILEIVNRGYHLSTHNDYLAILSDYGFPGLILYLIFLVLVFKKVFRRIVYPAEDDEGRFWTQYNFIMFSCLVIFGLAAENFQHPLFWFLLMFNTKS